MKNDSSDTAKQRLTKLRELVLESTSKDIEQKPGTKSPSFYVGDNFVRFLVFDDHTNIEAKAIRYHEKELSEYKITAKGLLQIFENQDIPEIVLKKVFTETLE